MKIFTRIEAVLLFPFLFVSAFSFAANLSLDPDSERFMELLLNEGRNVLNNALPIHRAKGQGKQNNQQGSQWYFPLTDYSDSLGFAVQVSPGTGLAEGFVITESRKFNLDLGKCHVDYEGKSENFTCGEVILYRDEIWIPQHLLEKWFPVTIDSIDLLGSRVAITPREKIPLQARLEREKLAERAVGDRGEFDPGFPRQAIPFSLLEGPFLDPSFQLSRTMSSGSSENQVLYNSLFSGEVLGLETLGFLGGNNGKVDGGRLTFMRRDRDAKILGPLKARQIQLYDVDFPSLPLLSGGASGKGFFISSVPLEAPTTFEKNDFQGPLPPGWEVVLYRNEILVGRQLGNQEGRYFFKNIPLNYGKNVFRLSFFGPHGERKDEYKTFDINASFTRPGEHQYRLGWVLTEKKEQKLALQYTQNIFKYFNLSTGFLHTPLPKATSVYLGLLGVNELFLFSSNCALSENGGRGCEWNAQTGWGTTSLGAKHTRLYNLRTDLFPEGGENPTSETTANFAYVLFTNPGVGTTWEVDRKDYEANPSITSLKLATAIGLWLFNLNHEARYAFENSEHYSGALDVTFGLDFWRFRLAGDYAPRGLKSISGEMEITPPISFTVGTSAQYTVDTKALSLQVNSSYLMKDVSLGLQLGYREPKVLSASLRASFSVQRDPREGKWNFRRDSSAQMGAASVRVFHDLNRNGIWDSDEPLMKGVFVNYNQQELDTPTDRDGYVFLPALQPHTAVDLSLSSRSFQKNPFLRAAQKGVRFIPRLGKTAVIEMAVVTMGSIDGIVNILTSDGEVPKRGVTVELRDSKGKLAGQSKTDAYGNYNFEDVAPGNYQITISSAQRKTQKWKAEPENYSIEIPDDGTIENAKDFRLRY